jgi:hypothetical protein
VAAGARDAGPELVHREHGRSFFQCLDEPLHWTRCVSLDTVSAAPVSVRDADLLAGYRDESLGQRIDCCHLRSVLGKPPAKKALLCAERQQETKMLPEELQTLEVQVEAGCLERRHCVHDSGIPRLSLLQVFVPPSKVVHASEVAVLSRCDLRDFLQTSSSTSSSLATETSSSLAATSMKSTDCDSCNERPHARVDADEDVGRVAWSKLEQLLGKAVSLSKLLRSLDSRLLRRLCGGRPIVLLLLLGGRLLHHNCRGRRQRTYHRHRSSVAVGLELVCELAVYGLELRNVKHLTQDLRAIRLERLFCERTLRVGRDLLCGNNVQLVLEVGFDTRMLLDQTSEDAVQRGRVDLDVGSLVRRRHWQKGVHSGSLL